MIWISSNLKYHLNQISSSKNYNTFDTSRETTHH
jgi:hypothetical protein